MALDEKKMSYMEEVFGKEHATRILADWDKRGKALEELNVEFKDFSQPDGGEASADKQAAEQANKAVGDLLNDLLQDSSVPVTAALEAVKVAKVSAAQVVSLESQIKMLREEVKAIREGAPRASQSQATEVSTSHLSAELQKNLREQNTVRDNFWGTEVVKP